MKLRILPVLLCAFILISFSRPEKEFKIFQFPINQIPRIDGDFSDWDMVPDSWSIGLDELMDTEYGHGTDLDPADYNIEVKTGWVKGLNRLYFYIEAYDDYWDFDDPALGQDIFELVVDGNISGGPFIKQHNGNTNKLSISDLHFKGHGEHAQNYHIFTPVQNKEWVMIWGNQHWIKEFPWYNSASQFEFSHSESGVLKMEFWVTPFDHASPQGYNRSVVSELKENEIIGMSWCILDFDGKKCEAFMNLAHNTKMIYDASYLCAFRLMPLEKEYRENLKADWEFIEIDRDQRWIQFIDRSEGDIDSWKWDFGDGTSSSEKSPAHKYDKAGEWTVVLTISGENGKSVKSKVWDVVTR